MADPRTYRPKSSEIPTQPGVYKFRDQHGRVIYVGKAISLRQRLSSYFADLGSLHPRTRQMVTTAASVEWTVVTNEVEALQLEFAWIKEFDPRFNVKYRDDKSYPFLAVTMGEEFPRVQVMRGKKRKGTRYFGPYSHAWAIRETVDLLLRVFPIRSCSAGVFKRAAQSGRPCLLGYIDKCSAPCVGRIDPEAHRELAEDFCSFMAGDSAPYVRRLEEEMKQAASELEFERAARLRDDLGALRKVLDKNTVVLPERTDADIFAMATDELEASVQVFYVRGGRIRGQRGWVTERVEELSQGEMVDRLLLQVYGDAEEGDGDTIPREVIVPTLPDDVEDLEALLTSVRGSRVSIRIAQRGDKRALAETVHRNAEQALALHKTRRAGDLTARSVALQELQDQLGLSESPLRIECYDISHTGGTEQVASMVVFEDGLPRKAEYRHFVVRGEHGDGARDDTEAMFEVLTRRFRRYLVDASGSPAEEGAEELEPSRRPKRFAYPPNLVVVDGGAPQVAAAQRALAELGVVDVAIVGLAKRLEEVWVPGEEFPLVLPRTSEGLYLLQRVRDEAHRFAITHHRKRRAKRMTRSELEGVPGLGPTRQSALLRAFGSVKNLRAATTEEIAAVPGIGPKMAEVIATALPGAARQERDPEAADSDVVTSSEA
ncbi:excinuclease ABC subunit UvrC [Pseudactinotalea terrae]|uniref:excinuclease ABC subunit UvrC n=1 Tax=Pseudactinotalea terrae TaxID=1743262 RepID=UPI0012E2135B|nr:excinuclease ABC subunit UvrC [Pseudactinotalea terrae]